MDRYILSFLAYHNIIVERQLEKEYGLSDLLYPNLTVILTINAQVLEQRLRERPPKHKYEADQSFLMEVQAEYLRLSKNSDNKLVLDTSFKNITQTKAEIILQLS